MPAILKPLEWQKTEEMGIVAFSTVGAFMIKPDEKSGLVRLYIAGQSSDDDAIWYSNFDTAQEAATEEYKRRVMTNWIAIF